MASLTRNRSNPDTYPCEENAYYYRQRAKETGAGLIIAEAAYIYPQGSEWLHAPGIYDSKHAQAWRKVVDAVHDEGCAIVAQLHHVGRIAHPESPEQIKAGHPVYAPSPIAARGGKVSHRQ
jgi:2,4-dienoyl-CoA reductase-like NADH-dependent reductase (Old Yellow Enzyme family)